MTSTCISLYPVQTKSNKMKSMLEDLCCYYPQAFEDTTVDKDHVSVDQARSQCDAGSRTVNFTEEERTHVSDGTTASCTLSRTRSFEDDCYEKNIIIIQSFIRRLLARKKTEAAKIRQTARKKMDRLKRHHAAIRIQLFARYIIAKNRIRQKVCERSAIVIQSRARGNIARKNVRDLQKLIENHARRLVRQQEEEFDLQLIDAKPKRMVAECNDGTSRLMMNKLKTNPSREVCEVNILEDKAIFIQTWVRRMISRKKSYQRKDDFLDVRNFSAIVIQSHVRGMLTRNRTQKHFHDISRAPKVEMTIFAQQGLQNNSIRRKVVPTERKDKNSEISAIPKAVRIERKHQNNKVATTLRNPATSMDKKDPPCKNSVMVRNVGVSDTNRDQSVKTYSSTLHQSTKIYATVHKTEKANIKKRRVTAAILIQKHLRSVLARKKVAKLRTHKNAEIPFEYLPLASSSIAVFEHAPTMSQITHDEGSEMMYCENSLVDSTATPPKPVKKGLKSFLAKRREKKYTETQKVVIMESSGSTPPVSSPCTAQNDQDSSNTDGEGYATSTIATTVTYFTELVSNLSLSTCVGSGISVPSFQVCDLGKNKSEPSKSSLHVQDTSTSKGRDTNNTSNNLDRRDDKDSLSNADKNRQLPEKSVSHPGRRKKAKQERRKPKRMEVIKVGEKVTDPTKKNTAVIKPKIVMPKFFSKNKPGSKVDTSGKVSNKKASSEANSLKKDALVAKKKKGDSVQKGIPKKETNKKKIPDARVNTSKKDTSANTNMNPDPNTSKNIFSHVTFIPVSLSQFHNQDHNQDDTTTSISEKGKTCTKTQAPSTKQNKKKNLRKWFSKDIDKAPEGQMDEHTAKHASKHASKHTKKPSEKDKVYGRTVNIAYFA